MIRNRHRLLVLAFLAAALLAPEPAADGAPRRRGGGRQRTEAAAPEPRAPGARAADSTAADSAAAAVLTAPDLAAPGVAPSTGPGAPVTHSAPPPMTTPPVERRPPTGPLNRLMWSDFAYQGAFACPRTEDWAFLDFTAVTYVPTRGTLLAASRKGVVELSVPEPVLPERDDVRQLPVAEQLTRPVSLAETFKVMLPFKMRRLGGFAWMDGRLWIAMNEYYNVDATDNVGIVTLDDSLGDPRGAWRVGPRGVNKPTAQTFHANKTHGYVCAVPPAWAATYAPGKTLASGRQRPAGAFGGAQGPALFAFEPRLDARDGADLGGVPLLIYPTNGKKWLSGEYRNDDTYVVSWVWTDKGQTVLIGSTKGRGRSHYGPGPPGCYSDKGWHSQPYDPELYLIDAFDLGQVAAGAMRPWEPQPYERLVPDFPWRTPEKGEDPNCRHPWFSGLAYDPLGRRLFVLQARAYEGEHSNGSIVHVFRVSDG
jgi:hypothetical protein